MKISEFELIDRLRKKIPRRLQGPLGIGDDAGVLPGAGTGLPRPCILTTDTIVEGVDFRFGEISPERAGRKSLAVNLSDVAAMGAQPVAFVVALGIPKNLSEHWIEKFYEGMIGLAKRYSVHCVGGDISRAREFFVSITLVGREGKGSIVTRAGARPGDWIAVTGSLGGSILGRHFRFEPRIWEGLFLSYRFHPHSMIDISDGLVQDLGHILKASRVGAQLDLDQIPVSSDAQKLARRNFQKALEHALTDGEDFELLFTIPAARRKRLESEWRKHFPRVRLSWIGRIQTRREKIEWCWKGKRIPPPRLKKAGFAHF